MIPRALGVLGAGQMGAGIAQVAAVSGIQVTLADLSEKATSKGRASILRGLDRLVAKQQLTQESAAAALQRIQTVQSMQVHLVQLTRKHFAGV